LNNMHMRIFLTWLFFLGLITARAAAADLPDQVSEALKHAHIPLSSVSILV